MANQQPNLTHTEFDAQAAIDQAWADFLETVNLPTEKEQANASNAAIARILYLDEHKTEPPDNAIPTFGDVVAYTENMSLPELAEVEADLNQLETFSPDAAGACKSFVYGLYTQFASPGSDGRLEKIVKVIEGNLGKILGQRLAKRVGENSELKAVIEGQDLTVEKVISKDVILQIYNDFLGPEKMFAELLKVYIEARKNGFTGKYPARRLVDAWQKAATAVPITKAVDVSYPVALRLPFGAVSAQEIEAEKDCYLPVFEPFDAQIMLDLEDERTNQLARHLPIRSWLMDWNTGGKAKGGHGGRVPVWLRLFLEALVCSDPSRFWGNRVVFYELEYLYKLVYGDKARWDKVRVRQLRRMIDIASRAVVVLRDGGEVLPVNFKYFEGLEKDSKIFVEVAAVRDARGGALTAIEDLRAAYRSSNATLQAYLSASEYLDRVWTRNGRLLYETVPVKNADGVILDHLGDPIMTKNGKLLKAVEGADKEKEDKEKEDKKEGKPLMNLKNADKEIVERVMREPNPKFTPQPVTNDELLGVCWVDNRIPISQRRKYKKRALETWGDLTIIALEETDQDSSFIRPSQKHRNTYRAVNKASEQAKNQ